MTFENQPVVDSGMPSVHSEAGADTIYALASGAPPSAIAVMRLSGPKVDSILAELIIGKLPEPRRASLRVLRDPTTNDMLDQALVLRFAAGSSYTGDDSVELHLHGGEAVIRAVEAVLLSLGARMAKPGEFSRRALASGNLDLTQAEAIGALIHAETEAARRQALRVLDGAIGRLAQDWRSRLIETAAFLETGVDFVDEELGDELIGEAARRLGVLADEFERHQQQSEAFDEEASALSIALIGPPNAGKSSLLNAIAGRDLAIVTDRAGTTRDVLRTQLKVAGVALELADTAGQRESDDPIEAEGVRRAVVAAGSAWRRIYVLSRDTEAEGRDLLSKTPPMPGDAVFWTKSDLEPDAPADLAETYGPQFFVTNAEDGTARGAFQAYLTAQRPARLDTVSPIAGSARRVALVRQAAECLRRASTMAQDGAIELAASELREAMTQVDALIGGVDHEQILDVVFSSFCIGK